MQLMKIPNKIFQQNYGRSIYNFMQLMKIPIIIISTKLRTKYL
jgi:hypothetical protein